MFFTEEVARVKELLTNPVHRPLLLLLEGNLGAGKTTFVKELFSSYGADPDEIPSPTFLKLIEHEIAGIGLCLHIDAYRIEDSDDCARLALELYEGMVLCVVEWPKVMMEYFKNNPELFRVLGFGKIIEIKIDMDSNEKRKLSIRELPHI